MTPEVFILLKSIKDKINEILSKAIIRPVELRQDLNEIANKIDDFVRGLENENYKKEG